jgi:hypothetical protein
MALAAKGVSLDPINGSYRLSYKEFPKSVVPLDEEAEARSPILATQQPSFTNPYDMR